MAIGTHTLGTSVGPLTFEYDWKDTALFGLSVGLGGNDLDFLYEKRGPKVLPTFALVPAYPVMNQLFAAVDGNFLGLVHSGQSFRFFKPFAPSGTVLTTGTVSEVYDLKRMAQVVFKLTSTDAAGELLCEAEASMIYRFDGGFGGQTPPRRPKEALPDRDPDARFLTPTRPDQALLFRLLGDDNPLHIDPDIAREVGFDRPILHGLGTLGAISAGVVLELCGRAPERLAALGGTFRKPVFPGDTLETRAWRSEDADTPGLVQLQTLVPARESEVVVSGLSATLRS